MDANKHTQFYLGQLEPLVGGVIEDAVRTDGDEFGDEFFGLAIRCKDGEVRHLIILADDEGNGPGSFEIVEGENHLSGSTSSNKGTAGSEAIPTVVAWIEGGIVQWMASDHPMRYLVLDADTDGNDSMDVTMENGSIAEVIRTSSTMLAAHLPEWVTKLVEEVEGQ